MYEYFRLFKVICVWWCVVLKKWILVQQHRRCSVFFVMIIKHAKNFCHWQKFNKSLKYYIYVFAVCCINILKKETQKNPFVRTWAETKIFFPLENIFVWLRCHISSSFSQIPLVARKCLTISNKKWIIMLKLLGLMSNDRENAEFIVTIANISIKTFDSL